jgi:hypothetical protein
MSSFGDIEEAWLPATSILKFCDNFFDYLWGRVLTGVSMFREFEQNK